MLQRMQHNVTIVGSSAIQHQCFPSLTMSQEGDSMTMKQIAQPCDLSQFTSYYNTRNIYLSVSVHNQVLSNLTWHKQKQTWFLSNYQIKKGEKVNLTCFKERKYILTALLTHVQTFDNKIVAKPRWSSRKG